eukprot:8228030-Pyramimonas_sp.AAC.1
MYRSGNAWSGNIWATPPGALLGRAHSFGLPSMLALHLRTYKTVAISKASIANSLLDSRLSSLLSYVTC